MIKKLLSTSMIALTFGLINAQTNLTSHFDWALSNPASPRIAYYALSGGQGYISGTNITGASAVVQLFNNQTGVTGAGTISSVKVAIALKNDVGGSFQIKVWENNNGAIGTEIGSMSFNLADVNTAQSAFQLIQNTPASVNGVYNVDAVFASPISFPAGGFWAGFTIPTTAAAGDTIVGLTTVDSVAAYSMAGTHSGLMIGGQFVNYAANSFNAANAIFPTVTFSTSTVGMTTSTPNSSEIAVYPNPSNDIVNFRIEDKNIATFVIYDMTGKQVNSIRVENLINQVDITSYNAGLYLYQMKSQSGHVIHSGKFNVNR